MQYLKLTSGSTMIEFHNSWTGEESVTVNGTLVSKKSSVWGIQHHFTVNESGDTVHYLLSSKVSEITMQTQLDVYKNGSPIFSNVPIPYASKPKSPANDAKKEGLNYMKNYDMALALESFQKALKFEPNDAETYFNIACIYSNMEKTEDSLANLKIAVAKGLANTDMIHTHELLAYVRIQKEFEAFVQNGYT